MPRPPRALHSPAPLRLPLPALRRLGRAARVVGAWALVVLLWGLCSARAADVEKGEGSELASLP
jgi:hypothetical protein